MCGYDCTKPCHCQKATILDKISGNCSNGCKDGWSASQCEITHIEKDENTSCKRGVYGINCSNRCNENCNGDQSGVCNDENGKCFGGCKAGWKGEICDQTCTAGSYGINCEEICSKKCKGKDLDCNHTTGHCLKGCKRGWTGDRCDKECEKGRYGKNCMESCSEFCYNGCNKKDGTCLSGCVAGRKGQMCQKACTQGEFGPNCSNRCSRNCFHGNKHCNKTSGHCFQGCQEGWKGSLCNQGCAQGEYGLNCLNTCSINCFHGNKHCNKISGQCVNGCKAGWQGSLCNKECEKGRYGKKCVGSCSEFCYNGCNKKDGTCLSGCVAGRKGKMCQQACARGEYGPNCSNRCSRNCFHGNKDCDKTSGHCFQGCMEGWKGSLCDQGCAQGEYGHNCSNICSINCFNGNKHCNKASGQCLNGCKEGWQGLLCNRVCTNGTYGRGCLRRCLSNCKYSICDKINGRCLQCYPGYRGQTCTLKCYKERYGQNCSKTCNENCKKRSYETSCDPVSGSCLHRCKDGWQGSMCDLECVAGTFGVECKSNCSSNCKNGTCDHVNGTCLGGCKPGYQGDHCRDICKPGKYGLGCKNNCPSNCKHEDCDYSNGTCTEGCKPGYQGNMCEESCTLGKFGENCAISCSDQCKGGYKMCRNTDGRCLKGCETGWNGTKCSSACDVGFYGENCESVCGYCESGTSCNHETGTCYGGCKTGYTGDTCLQAIQTSNSLNAAAAGSVIGLVIIIIVAFIVVVLYKRRGNGNKRNDEQRGNIELTHPGTTADGENRRMSNSGNMHTKPDENDSSADEMNIYNNCQMPEQTRNPIPLSNLLSFVKQNLANPHNFADEFKEIPYGMQKSSTIAKKSCNRGKNRYKDMHAYDESRVVLKTQPNERGTDYINATFIKGHHKEKAYIAAQGPIEASVDDFWRMIWQKDVYTIAMVTNLVEEIKTKCLQYWPPVETRTRYGYLTVYTVSEIIYADFTIRNFRVLFEGKSERNIRQFHFTSWPDKSVPSTTSSLLQFWRKVRKNDETKEHTWLVHCSAGVGRTGTFIATDILYDQGKDKGYIDVYQCVKDLRDQRVNMVQTKDQYVYLHTLMVEALILASEPAALDDLHQVVRDLKTVDQRTKKTRLLLQYETLKEDVTPLRTQEQTEEMYSAALLEENKNKNRFTNILPLNIFRPFLVTNIPGCTHYINAVNMPSYSHKLGYIITQKPLENTVIDYYRLIYEQNVKVIVTFPDNDNGKDRVGVDMSDVGPFTMTKVSEEDKLFYTKRIFNMAYSSEDTSKVTLLEFKNWNENRIIPRDHANMLYFMQEVEFLNRVADDNPVLVQCLDGSEKSGLFVALMNIVEHARLDNEVSIPQVIRQLRSIRQQIIPNFEQFQFCYDALICYIDSNQMYANM